MGLADASVISLIVNMKNMKYEKDNCGGGVALQVKPRLQPITGIGLVYVYEFVLDELSNINKTYHIPANSFLP